MALGISATGWIVGGTIAAGAYGANKAAKAQDRATEASERIASESMGLSREELDWAKKKYADEAPARAAAEKRAGEVSDAMLTGMKSAEQRAADLEAYNKTTFRPLEQGLVKDAQEYDTPMRRLAAAESAMSGVDASAQAVQQAQARELGRAGVAPGSTKAMALAEDSAVARSKVRAAAGTTAVNNVEQQGVARRMDAASLGRGLPSAQATQQQIATQAGSASAGSGMQALVAAESGKGNVMNGYNGAINGLSSAAGMYSGLSRQYGQQMNDSISGMGSLVNLGVQQGWFKSPKP